MGCIHDKYIIKHLLHLTCYKSVYMLIRNENVTIFFFYLTVFKPYNLFNDVCVFHVKPIWGFDNNEWLITFRKLINSLMMTLILKSVKRKLR